ncbi:MAG: hypothetical protein MI785_29430 [Kiloniellales bacterium]|nr:hypothetical protein [Kiloniellales bacterium]
MFTQDRPYSFHIELTDKCNAACPMCPRTDHTNHCTPDLSKVQNIELSLADFQANFTDDFCRRVSEVDLCGSLGDPLAARDCLAICDHLTARGVGVSISTNASLRSTKWWTELGRHFTRTPSHVEFHIDGLADTNPLYRINTSFEKIIANAAAYIATGARAEWHYILFRHNEHQVTEAQALAKEMGFRKFVLIDTIRFGARDRFDYQLPNGAYRSLQPSACDGASFQTGFAERVAEAPPPAAGDGGIVCKSAVQNRPYINCGGYVSACCWTAGSNEELLTLDHAGLRRSAFNIRHRPLSEILAAEPFVGLFERAWLGGANPICQRKCGQMIRNKRYAV